MGIEHNLWKFELDPIIFLDFTGTWSLKYKENIAVCKTLMPPFPNI